MSFCILTQFHSAHVLCPVHYPFALICFTMRHSTSTKRPSSWRKTVPPAASKKNWQARAATAAERMMIEGGTSFLERSRSQPKKERPRTRKKAWEQINDYQTANRQRTAGDLRSMRDRIVEEVKRPYQMCLAFISVMIIGPAEFWEASGKW